MPTRCPRAGSRGRGCSPRGSTADETQVCRAGRFGLPYVNSKHEAESVAMRLAAQGLPVVVVNPAHIFGRGDLYGSSTVLVLRFLRRQIPAYVDGALNIVDAEDVARGHLLADERGEVGDRYILGNRNFTLDRTLGAIELLRQDGITGYRAWFGLLRFMWVSPGMMRKIFSAWAKFFLPRFHPWNEDDRHLLRVYDSSAADAPQPVKKVRRAA